MTPLVAAMLFTIVQASLNLEVILIIRKLGGNVCDSYLEEGNKLAKLYRRVTRPLL